MSEIPGKVMDAAAGGGGDTTAAAVRGTVVLMKKNVLDFNDFNASIIDDLHDLLGEKISLQLISDTGKVGKAAFLEDWIRTGTSLITGESAYKVTFEWEEGFSIPGALLIKNNHHSEFYLKTVTLEDSPLGHGKTHFICSSWVYPTKHCNKDRVFFSNKTYLPHDMPMPLRKYREEELVALRGDGRGELKEWDRIYDYAYYNDLGDPDKDSDHVRPVLGGSENYPYPRRVRTGRPPTNSDPNTESRLQLQSSLDIYVPRDERFGHLKMSDFLAYALKSAAQYLKPELEKIFDKTPKEFDSFEDYLQIYLGGINIPLVDNILGKIPSELLKEILNTDGAGLLKYPMPEVIKEDKSVWRTDEEFAREMLAGVNPVLIQLLRDFPPRSKLDPKRYGNQHSSITKTHIEKNLDGLTVEEALRANRLFILDHHDAVIPYLRTINSNTSTRTYATRTILLLKNDDTLKPLAIELSLPHPNGDGLGAVSKVYTPAKEGVEGSIWQLAKAYACVNDSGYHQLISHFLHTHAAAEPFIIAANRQLSVVHPIYKLLQPHFRDNMNINAFARQILINAGGILEFTVFPGKYAMEMSSLIYKSWVFLDQALPRDLKLRGMAVDDPESNHGLRLLIKDYPFAVDGLEIWSAIQKWVEDYCSFYYKTDNMVQQDPELQSWWKEIREEGHGDKRHEQQEWPKMQTVHDLIETCTIMIWICSALHAAVNFGQYPYAGYMPNRPTLSRRFMPEEGSPEYAELEMNFEKAYLKTIPDVKQTLAGISIIEILSRHASDEVYLGQRETAEWTTDAAPLAAFESFGKRLAEIEERIDERNRDEKLKNRVGQVKIPYTLLFPTGEPGIGGKGIPNSVSI